MTNTRGETYLEALVRRNHAQVTDPLADVVPWFEHGMIPDEVDLSYSVCETDIN